MSTAPNASTLRTAPNWAEAVAEVDAAYLSVLAKRLDFALADIAEAVERLSADLVALIRRPAGDFPSEYSQSFGPVAQRRSNKIDGLREAAMAVKSYQRTSPVPADIPGILKALATAAEALAAREG